NHGATLIIWDRLFGTFEEEKAEVIYGVTEPVASWNAVWVNFHYYRDLLRDARAARRWIDKLKVWGMPPGWRPAAMQLSARTPAAALDAPKYDARVSRTMARYVFAQFVAALGLAVFLIFSKERGPLVLMPMAIVVLATFLVLGGLLDGRRWARRI